MVDVDVFLALNPACRLQICDSNICTKTVCEASEESCRGDKDLSLNKDYFYPGFTEFEA